MEYTVIPNDKDTNDEIIIDDGDSISSAIDPLQNEMMQNLEAENEK